MLSTIITTLCCALAHFSHPALHHAGEIIRGRQPLAPPKLAGDLGKLMSWVDARRRLGVLTNADTPADAEEVGACMCGYTPALCFMCQS